MKNVFATLTCLSILIGCGGGNGSPDLVIVDGDTVSTAVLLKDSRKYRSFFADTTLKNWNRFHGTQVEYHSADGQTWLVYPGNTRSVRGQWDVQERNGRIQMCYRYGRNSYNPVTGQNGGRWECRSGLDPLQSDIVVDGDVLKLRGRGAYPQPLPKKTNISLSTIKKTLGLGELKARNKIVPK